MRPTGTSDATPFDNGGFEMSPLAFFCAEPEAPRALATEQIASFNERGFLSPLDALSATEANESRRYFDGLLDDLRARDDGRNPYSIMGYQTRCRGIWDLAHHPRVLDYVEDLIGPDFVCWSTHFFCKLPGDMRPVPFHQDAGYWPIRPTKTVTAWLAIDDVGLDNAPVRFLAGSHRRGKLPWNRAKDPSILHQEIPDPDRYGEACDNVMRAGQISIHSGTVVHGSEGNSSGRRRCGLALRYVPSECTVVVDDAKHLLLDAAPGRGDTGVWKRNERPPADDLTMIHGFYRDGAVQ